MTEMANNLPDSEYLLVIKPSGMRTRVLKSVAKTIQKANACLPVEKRDRIYPYTKGAEFQKGLPEDEQTGITKTIETVITKHSQEISAKDAEIEKLRKQLKDQKAKAKQAVAVANTETPVNKEE